MRTLIITILLGTAVLALAKDAETLDQLKARADAADKHKQTELYAELSRRQIEAADQQYNTNVDQAKSLLEEGVQSAEKSAQACLDTGKNLKKVEITLRKIENRVKEMQPSWAFEDRQPFPAAIKRIDDARSKLLDRMFRK